MHQNLSILPVILAGGSGTRLWPLSRQTYPKQFLSIGQTEQTLLQNTITRLSSLNTEVPNIICNEMHRFIVAEQLRQINKENSNIILEPFSRNTAPAIALSALLSLESADIDDPILLVLSADHAIEDEISFCNSIKRAIPLALNGSLVTFGVQPNKPETGYGYIKKGERIGEAFKVQGFFEKPSAELAKEYVDTGTFLWNSGIFMFKASAFLDELEYYSPEIYKHCKSSIKNKSLDFTFTRVDKDEFERCPSDSIDYAVMEKTNKAVVIELNTGWSDIGSWDSLWEISKKQSDGNVIVGDVISEESSNCYIHSQGKLTATLGIKDLIVINTKDALLVANKRDSQKIKEIISKLSNFNRIELIKHSLINRPWGNYETVDSGLRYQVKRITVKPGGKLSVQMHYHRAEHWVVVSGTALITNNEETFLLSENQSTYIPAGVTHSLENPGKIPLELIEVQSGAYLGEDDIVRLQDKYGRS